MSCPVGPLPAVSRVHGQRGRWWRRRHGSSQKGMPGTCRR